MVMTTMKTKRTIQKKLYLVKQEKGKQLQKTEKTYKKLSRRAKNSFPSKTVCHNGHAHGYLDQGCDFALLETQDTDMGIAYIPF